jgi:hypothetical protein
MGKTVRTLPEDHDTKWDFQYRENEYSTTCQDCDCQVGVVIPDKIIKWAEDHDGDDSKIMKYLYEDYVFYCDECQKENGREKERC